MRLLKKYFMHRRGGLNMGLLEKVPPLQKLNRLHPQIYANGRGGFIYPP